MSIVLRVPGDLVSAFASIKVPTGQLLVHDHLYAARQETQPGVSDYQQALCMGLGRRNGGLEASPQKLSHIKEGTPAVGSVSVHASAASGVAPATGADQNRQHRRGDSLDELYWRGSMQQQEKKRRARRVRPCPTACPKRAY